MERPRQGIKKNDRVSPGETRSTVGTYNTITPFQLLWASKNGGSLTEQRHIEYKEISRGSNQRNRIQLITTRSRIADGGRCAVEEKVRLPGKLSYADSYSNEVTHCRFCLR